MKEARIQLFKGLFQMETSVDMNDDTLLLMQPKIHLLSHTFIIFQFNL